jgi:hypothetical protein
MSTVITPLCLLSFPRLFQPSAIGNDGKEDYGMVALIPEQSLETEQWTAVRRAMTQAAKEKFGTKLSDESFKSRLHLPIREAAEKSDKWNGFEPGRKFITMKRKKEFGPPQVVDKFGKPILDESLVYPGVVVRCGVRFFGYDTSGNIGVGCTVDMVQIIKTGEGVPRLDNKPDAAKVFAENALDTSAADALLKEMGIDPDAGSSGVTSDGMTDLDDDIPF